ncbi:uncharacterized protein LOC118344807 [Juglans regia]|uniref:Uncharacterized protein LOC118344807 n=1 Tax=Juglans regia TaxID=51240 RepID=A0A6P9E3M6_JUGRE|nr:uncharacterized protein LOC118344807 [Juglans regia]
MRNFQAGLDRCKQLLRTWSKDMNGKQRQLIRQRSEMIQELQRINQGDFNDTIKGYQREVNQLLAEEEIKWRQRAKQLWLKEGDKNTSYFHKCASQRKKNNSIHQIANERGEQVSNKSEVKDIF